jgi:hypothetical protein
MRWLGVRLQLLLTALLLLGVLVVADRSHYVCKMMGRAVAQCCCAGAHEPRIERAVAARSPDCCELIAASKQPFAAQAAPPPSLPLPLATLLPVDALPTPAFQLLDAPRPSARAPPALGPPLFIAHCTLLI